MLVKISPSLQFIAAEFIQQNEHIPLIKLDACQIDIAKQIGEIAKLNQQESLKVENISASQQINNISQQVTNISNEIQNNALLALDSMNNDIKPSNIEPANSNNDQFEILNHEFAFKNLKSSDDNIQQNNVNDNGIKDINPENANIQQNINASEGSIDSMSQNNLNIKKDIKSEGALKENIQQNPIIQDINASESASQNNVNINEKIQQNQINTEQNKVQNKSVDLVENKKSQKSFLSNSDSENENKSVKQYDEDDAKSVISVKNDLKFLFLKENKNVYGFIDHYLLIINKYQVLFILTLVLLSGAFMYFGNELAHRICFFISLFLMLCALILFIFKFNEIPEELTFSQKIFLTFARLSIYQIFPLINAFLAASFEVSVLSCMLAGSLMMCIFQNYLPKAYSKPACTSIFLYSTLCIFILFKYFGFFFAIFCSVTLIILLLVSLYFAESKQHIQKLVISPITDFFNIMSEVNNQAIKYVQYKEAERNLNL